VIAAPTASTPGRTAARTVGIVGAGQLARMTHRAAIDLGVDVLVLAATGDDAAVRGGARHIMGSHTDLDDLRGLAARCDVVTFDHEHVPPEHIRALEADGVAVRPGSRAALAAQDKLHARRLLGEELGLPVPPFAPVATTADVERFAAEQGWPVVLKARSGGYDGRGVQIVHDPDAAAAVLGAGGDWLAEAFVALDLEVAVLVARRPSGEAVVYPLCETVQQEGMCRELCVPAPLGAAQAAQAEAMALAIAAAIDAVGILAVELFVSGGRLLVNELALRPHNSGHWTIEGAVTSQFENHLRAVLDLPLGDPATVAPAVAMVNVVGPPGGGDPADRLAAALAIRGAHVHLYGKEARPGRKLGHVTALAPTLEGALQVARGAAQELMSG